MRVQSLELARSVCLAWTPSSLHCLCTEPQPGKSWLNYVTLASGAIGPLFSPASGLSLPPALSVGISYCSTSSEALSSPGKLQLIISTPCSTLAEPPCQPSSGRGGAPGEGRSSPKPECHRFPLSLPEVQLFCKHKHFSDGCLPSVDFQSTDCFAFWVYSYFGGTELADCLT